jgi:cytoskeletal protein CcmA (bactofilin family)
VVITGPVTVDRGDTADDVVVVDGPVSVAGRVRGDLVVVSGSLRISGTVDGDVVTFADRAVLAPGARIGGDLKYGDERPRVPDGATVEGSIDKMNIDEITDPVGFIGAAALWIAVSVSALVLGLLLLWLAPRALDSAFAAASTRIGPAIGWGLLLFFGLPILAVIALVTLVGIPLGVALLLALLPLYAIGYTTSAWLLGRRLVGPPRGRVLAFLAGLAVLRLLAIIPVVGGIVWFAATVVGLGALMVATWRARRDSHELASPAPA